MEDLPDTVHASPKCRKKSRQRSSNTQLNSPCPKATLSLLNIVFDTNLSREFP